MSSIAGGWADKKGLGTMSIEQLLFFLASVVAGTPVLAVFALAEVRCAHTIAHRAQITATQPQRLLAAMPRVALQRCTVQAADDQEFGAIMRWLAEVDEAAAMAENKVHR
jgi:hypothetical protein